VHEHQRGSITGVKESDAQAVNFDRALINARRVSSRDGHFFRARQLNRGLLNSIQADIASVVFVEGSASSPHFLHHSGS
jgi:hypothetical protein